MKAPTALAPISFPSYRHNNPRPSIFPSFCSEIWGTLRLWIMYQRKNSVRRLWPRSNFLRCKAWFPIRVDSRDKVATKDNRYAPWDMCTVGLTLSPLSVLLAALLSFMFLRSLRFLFLFSRYYYYKSSALAEYLLTTRAEDTHTYYIGTTTLTKTLIC